jgi:polyphosphate kinase
MTSNSKYRVSHWRNIEKKQLRTPDIFFTNTSSCGSEQKVKLTQSFSAKLFQLLIHIEEDKKPFMTYPGSVLGR